MSNNKAGEPDVLDQIPVSEKSLETVNSSSDDQYDDSDYWKYFSDRLTALKERACKTTFSEEYSNSDLDAIEKEVSWYFQHAEICLKIAYLKYLSAIGLNEDDVKFMADNIFISHESIYDRVQKADRAFKLRHIVFA